jgi:hypothetical protein
MEPETPPSRRRRTPGMVELSVALAALVVSAVSLYISQRQTQVMDRQLAATVWPAVQYSTSNLHGGEPVIAMSLENAGVGPARIHSFRVAHHGEEVADLTDFVTQCCAPEDILVRTITSAVEGRILPAGQTIDAFLLPAEDNDPEVFHRLDRVRGELDVQLCYCSVLEECWEVSRGEGEPRAVRSCR